ncbi:hypothetical protein FDZ74_09065, partial [bacterium]
MKHSNSAFKNGVSAGWTFTIVLMFLVLIGFNSSGAALLARFFGKAPLSGQLPLVGFGVAFLVLLAVWQGVSVSLKAKRMSQAHPWLGGLAATGLAGLVLGVFILLFGTLYENGADFRKTMYALSPAYVKFLQIELSPVAGAGASFLALALSGALAGWIATSLPFARIGKTVSAWWGKFWQSSPSRSVRASRYFKFGLFALLVVICFFLPRAWGS